MRGCAPPLLYCAKCVRKLLPALGLICSRRTLRLAIRPYSSRLSRCITCDAPQVITCTNRRALSGSLLRVTDCVTSNRRHSMHVVVALSTSAWVQMKLAGATCLCYFLAITVAQVINAAPILSTDITVRHISSPEPLEASFCAFAYATAFGRSLHVFCLGPVTLYTIRPHNDQTKRTMQTQ